MKANQPIPKNLASHIALVYVFDDAALYFKGERIGQSYDDENLQVHDLLKQIADQLSRTEKIPLHILQMELNDAELMDWNWEDISFFLFDPEYGLT